MLTMRYVMVVLLSGLYCYSAHAHDFCRADEMVVWGCSTKKKVYSVCASNDLSKDIGYIQYRVVSNGKLEFEYPESEVHPLKIFHFSLLAKGAMLSFDNNNYRYALFEGLSGEPSIVVSKDDKDIATTNCSSGSYTLTKTNVQKVLKISGIIE